MTNPFLQRWNHRVRHWGTMFAGTSYYHQPQGMGRVFVPGELKGYFNDLTGKTRWTGKVERDGLPFNTLTNGKVVRFPILLCQKALGHWDQWLMEGGTEDRDLFLRTATWLEQTQDSMGGWDTWGPLGQPQRYQYSAMTQGQAVSVMTRAYTLTKSKGLARACFKAMALFRKPVSEGGVCWYEGNQVFLEEFPASRRDTVLNGFIFSLFGLYDYLLTFPDEHVAAFYEEARDSLIRILPEYDAGFWSYYSSGTKRLASPFYHHLHLSQLKALSRIGYGSSVRMALDRWTSYQGNRLYKSWAIVRKGYQKLNEADGIKIAA